MSSIRYRRPTSVHVAYPAILLDPEALASFGIIAGTRADEDPPKVIMTQADWTRLVAAPDVLERSVQLLGDSWATNPTIPVPPEDAVRLAEIANNRRLPKAKVRGRFDHLKELPPDQAVIQARADHEKRLAGGADVYAEFKAIIEWLKREPNGK